MKLRAYNEPGNSLLKSSAL